MVWRIAGKKKVRISRRMCDTIKGQGYGQGVGGGGG